MKCFRWKVNVILMCIAVQGCSVSDKPKEGSSTTNFFSKKIVYIDANHAARKNVTNHASMIEHPNFQSKMTLAQAQQFEATHGLKRLHYLITPDIDKTNPNAVFYSNLNRFFILKKSTYLGRDKWWDEMGLELNASFEHWMVQDALDRIKKDKRIMTWRPDLIGGKEIDTVEGRKHLFPRNLSGMIKMIEFMLKKGATVKDAERVAMHCYSRTFFHFKFASKLPAEEREALITLSEPFKAYPGTSYRRADPSACDSVKAQLTVNNEQVFAGHKRLNPRSVRNETVKTIFIDNPSFDTGLWQHLFTTDLYKDHPRVRLEGTFSGLLYPEKAHITLGMNKRLPGNTYATYNDPYANVYSSKMTASHIAYQWFSDSAFSRHFDELNLKREWEDRIAETRRFGGSVSSSVFRCRNFEDLVNMQISGSYFNRYYKCSLDAGSNKHALGLGHFTSFDSIKGAGKLGSATPISGSLKFGEGLTASYHESIKECSDALYKPACEADTPAYVKDVIEKHFLRSVNPKTVVAYTRINENGDVQGIVHYWGLQFVYNLTDIAKWYQERMAPYIEDADPNLHPLQLVRKSQ